MTADKFMTTPINNHCQLPKNLILEAHITDYNSRWRDKYIWIINTIIFKRYVIGGLDEDFINLNFGLLKEYVGPEFLKKVLTQLSKSKVIEINNKFRFRNVFL